MLDPTGTQGPRGPLVGSGDRKRQAVLQFLSMERREFIAAGVLALGLGVIGYAFFAPENDDELVHAVLDDLADAVNFDAPIPSPVFFGSRLANRFETIFAETVTVQVAEVQGTVPPERSHLALAVAQAMSRYGSMHASFTDLEISIQESMARVDAVVQVEGNRQGEFRRDSRSVSVNLSKETGNWLIETFVVEARGQD